MVTNTEEKKPRWVHQPLTVNHFGYNASIKENGRVTINNEGSEHSGPDYDEIEVPASLIFKLARLLQDTRRREE